MPSPAILSPLYAPHFIATESAHEISNRLREDETLISEGKPCSWVAWHLPEYNTEKGFEIATHISPLPTLGHDLKKLIYDGLLNRIRRHLRNAVSNEKISRECQEQVSLDPSELSIALKVLNQLQDAKVIDSSTPAGTITAWLEQQVDLLNPPSQDIFSDTDETTMNSEIPKPPTRPQRRLCYICRLVLVNPHPTQPSMCIPCGDFNLASSLLSTPEKLSLPPTFTALVTGARVNLGYHTTLRLLRCGARVIATTRYPRDAVARYLRETDSAEWRERLRIVGADFRCAVDAFALVHETKKCLRAWADEDGGNAEMRLDLLVNNAAQTLTDSVKKEERAAIREENLKKTTNSTSLLIEGSYKARVRGEAIPKTLEGTRADSVTFTDNNSEELTNTPSSLITTEDTTTSNELEPYTKSSWCQSIFEIPYEDVISAHSVNAFVPLILCRELLPLMGTPPSSPLYPSTPPAAYIINVSSREGIFEDRLASFSKRGKHVHTNMSKVALNMITETEAATAWKTRGVAMNTVDPGYMSAAPEYEDSFDGLRPIGWEDGAGRVLWPVAVGVLEGRCVWGRFLKHYGVVNVDPGVGRG
ncbi:hypothetical protein CC80DRAFT_588711 [Byssothecium circinans]|uniref:NAD(P)-binding protein n=1 Tax=Byssothecium circinans TaxID=147558 RepID=A0A6A5UBG8_9PLEO|nr:hypothetical protein CC80DRAFT_588711 [Byssothecium circinans]